VSVRFAVLGLGRAGTTLHLPALRRLHAAAVAVVCDPDPSAGLGVREPRTADWREAVAADVDAVLVATPPETHAELAGAALEAGRHVYLEKPAATSASAAAELVALAERAGRSLQLGFAYRYHPLWRDARRLVERGNLRPPFQAHGRFAATCDGEGWASPAIDLGCHHVDLLSWLLGAPPVEVEAPAPDRVAVRWPDGSTLEGDYRPGPPEDRVTLGGIAVDRLRGVRLRGLPDPGLVLTRLRGGDWERSFERALAAFVSAVESGADPDPGGGTGVVGAAVGEAVLRSLASGRSEPVELPAVASA
jgi:predicted dehydrogenase